MFRSLALAAGLLLASIVGASAATVVLGSSTSGSVVGVEPPAGVLFDFEVADGTATSINLDLNVRHLGTSWGHETRVRVFAPGGELFVFRGGADFGWGATNGVFTTSFSRDITPTDAGGTWTVRLTDSFDDLVDPDYRVRAGSSIEIVGIAAVPVPAAGFLLMAGLGGFAFLRRKQS